MKQISLTVFYWNPNEEIHTRNFFFEAKDLEQTAERVFKSLGPNSEYVITTSILQNPVAIVYATPGARFAGIMEKILRVEN